MSAPGKGTKAINHRDVQYRWIMQNKRGTNELVVVASAPVDGQPLIVELPRVVTTKMIPDAIDYANENGWTPNETAPPFRCKWSRRQFEKVEG